MSDLICRKTMMRCQTPGMCAPYGGCRAEVAILASNDSSEIEKIVKTYREAHAPSRTKTVGEWEEWPSALNLSYQDLVKQAKQMSEIQRVKDKTSKVYEENIAKLESSDDKQNVEELKELLAVSMAKFRALSQLLGDLLLAIDYCFKIVETAQIPGEAKAE